MMTVIEELMTGGWDEGETEAVACCHCGREFEQEGTEDYCPACQAALEDADEAEAEMENATAEVERLQAELAEAVQALKAAAVAHRKATRKFARRGA